MDGRRQAAGESENCSSTCTCSAIHHPAGDRGCSGEDRICNWRPFRAHQKAAYGVIAHCIRVKWGIVQLALFVSVKVAVFHNCWEIFLVCASKANQALSQAHPIDALHLTSIIQV